MCVRKQWRWRKEFQSRISVNIQSLPKCTEGWIDQQTDVGAEKLDRWTVDIQPDGQEHALSDRQVRQPTKQTKQWTTICMEGQTDSE